MLAVNGGNARDPFMPAIAQRLQGRKCVHDVTRDHLRQHLKFYFPQRRAKREEWKSHKKIEDTTVARKAAKEGHAGLDTLDSFTQLY